VIIFIIAVFVGFSKLKDWYDNNQIEKTRQLREILYLKKTINEDSLTISSQTTTISDGKQIIDTQSKNIINLRDKYNSTLESYMQLQTMIDSIKTDKDTVTVTHIDTLTAVFEETMGGGWFRIWGKINKNPLYVYGMGMLQIKPIIIEVSLEKLPGEEYITYTYVNYPELSIVNKPIRVLDKKRWIDKIGFIGQVSAIKFGAGIGLSYDNYGISYVQFIDSPALLFSYHKVIGDLF
jgi:hypothetical protein